MSCPKGTNLVKELARGHGSPVTDGLPKDGGIVAPQDLAWSANPVVSLRPIASDLNTKRRGRDITT
jgi:hypothetical protein